MYMDVYIHIYVYRIGLARGLCCHFDTLPFNNLLNIKDGSIPMSSVALCFKCLFGR